MTTITHPGHVTIRDLSGVFLVRVDTDLPGVFGEVQVLAGRVLDCLSCGVTGDRHTDALQLELSVIGEGLVHPAASTRLAASTVLRGLHAQRTWTAGAVMRGGTGATKA